jgi:hypothetical protein
MINEWQPGRPFALHANRHLLGRPEWNQQGVPRESAAVIAWNILSLQAAELWWVDATMVDLLESSCEDLPPVELTHQLVPAEPVLCIFERPIQGVDADDPDSTLLVDGMLWGWATSSYTGPTLSTTIYSRYKLSEPLPLGGGAYAVTPDAREDEEIWTPLGRTDWPLGNDWAQELNPPVAPSVQASNTEDRRWLATLWALADSPRIVEINQLRADRPERRRALRAGLSEPTVKVVNLRRSVYAMAGAEREPLDDSGRRYTVRWPVKGFWRNQACGPGHTQRRPTFVAPHIRGPEGAPLKAGATVKVLR